APWLQQEYADAEIFRPWGGWTRVYMAVHPFAFGVVFAAAFLLARPATGGFAHAGGARGGAAFGLGVFVIGALPVFALCYASLRMPATVIAAWMAQSCCQYVTAGTVLGWYSRASGGRCGA